MKSLTEKKIRIAILLGGQLRHWDIVSKMFKLYNNIYTDVQYDFFLSTWDDGFDEIDYDMNSYTFLTKYEFVQPNPKLNDCSVSSYYYLLKQVNKLKNDYVTETNVKYDCIVATRPDIYFDLGLLDSINELIIGKKQHNFIPSMGVYTQTGTKPYVKIINGEPEECYYSDDKFIIGSSNSINIYCNLHDTIIDYTLSDNRILGHITHATYLVKQMIINLCISTDIKGGVNTGTITRATHVDWIGDLSISGELDNIYNRLTNFPKIFTNEFFKLSSSFIKTSPSKKKLNKHS